MRPRLPSSRPPLPCDHTVPAGRSSPSGPAARALLRTAALIAALSGAMTSAAAPATRQIAPALQAATVLATGRMATGATPRAADRDTAADRMNGAGGTTALPPSSADPAVLARTLAALRRAQAAVLGVQVLAVDDGRTLGQLGQARSGSGIVIDDDGLVLTIGYLLIEAEQVVLQPDDGRRVPARVLGWDAATGLGLVQALAPLRIDPAPLAAATAPETGEPLMVVSGGEDGMISLARLMARRAYTGHWEYHLTEAYYTAPARPDHSGAGLFNREGELLGVGSLLLRDIDGGGSATALRVEASSLPGNVFVPAALLPPILAELRSRGTTRASERAWLGLNCTAEDGRVRVLRVQDDSPADVAGLQAGDEILRLDGQEIGSVEALWQTLWAPGESRREVRLDIRRDGQPLTLQAVSVDRRLALKRPTGI
ncbi:S1C family serine protease [Pseudaquabacterium rugosum]|uniref:S1C family serine protease n=1 Tax=Pseudaquabacterium rugosum TaxID=2984194 RepID=A0ABU9B6F2_9BURK